MCTAVFCWSRFLRKGGRKRQADSVQVVGEWSTSSLSMISQEFVGGEARAELIQKLAFLWPRLGSRG